MDNLGECSWCDEPVLESEDHRLVPHLGECGHFETPYHWLCLVRQILGGLNHLKGTCTCCGGTDPADPPEMTKRQAAEAAAHWFHTHHQTLPPVQLN